MRKPILGILSVFAAIFAVIPASAETKYSIGAETVQIGPNSTSTKTLRFNRNAGSSNPAIRANGSTGILEFSNDGASWNAFSAGSVNSAEAYDNGSITASVSGNALTIAMKTKAGSDPSSGSPVSISFRNATSGTGTFNTRTVTSALSIVVPSGATLGNVSGVLEPVHVYAQDNSGTVQLCVSTSGIFDEGSTHTSTTIDSDSDSRGVLYCTAGTTAPVRLIGRIKSTQTTAGTWASTPSEISNIPFAMSHMASAAPIGWRVETVSGTCSGSSSIARQSGSWVSALANQSSERCTVTISGGIFSDTPICVASNNNSADGKIVDVDLQSSTSVRVGCIGHAGGTCGTYGFSLICMGPK